MAFVRHLTLTPSSVSTVTLTSNDPAVEILSRNGIGEVYATIGDGTVSQLVPTVAGNDCEVLPAAIGSIIVRRTFNAPIVVKLISAQAVNVSLRGVA